MAFLFTHCDAGQDGSMCAGWAGAAPCGMLNFSRGSYDLILHLIYEKKYFGFYQTYPKESFGWGSFCHRCSPLSKTTSRSSKHFLTILQKSSGSAFM